MKRTARLRPVSKRTRASRAAFKLVYDMVDARSGGWCEVHGQPCRAIEHHHIFRPRKSFHAPRYLLHVCRKAHEEFEKAYARGRRVIGDFDENNGRYTTLLITVPDKWAARELCAKP